MIGRKAESSRNGEVKTFDAGSGLGTVLGQDGNEYDFHCIEIADGSREIEVGVQVSFDVLPKLGRYEASNLRQ